MTNRTPGQPSKIWLAFAVSPFEMLVALYFGLFGVASVLLSDIISPASVDEAYPLLLIAVWHGLLAFGGLATFIGRMFEFERLELCGLAGIVVASGYYIAALLIIAGAVSTAAAGAYICIAVGAIFRMWVIRKSLQGQKMVGKIVVELRRNGEQSIHPSRIDLGERPQDGPQ